MHLQSLELLRLTVKEDMHLQEKIFFGIDDLTKCCSVPSTTMEGYRAHNSNTQYALYLIPFTCYGCLLCFTTKCLSVVCSLHSTK